MSGLSGLGGAIYFLVPAGVLIGAFGTLIGAGGGFILMPVLLLLYPRENPDLLTSISLAVVFFNALSGSAAYARLGRIDYRSGLIFAAAAIPGAVVGALSTAAIPRRVFDGIFGVLMAGLAVFLAAARDGPRGKGGPGPADGSRRTLVDAEGRVYRYSYRPALGIAISAGVGYLSSLLGIGGGIIHVPAMARLLGFPVHIATATSHFVLAIMALAGSTVHLAQGTLARGAWETLLLGAGVAGGAQLGAAVSGRIRGKWILRGLAAALAIAGVRIALLAFV